MASAAPIAVRKEHGHFAKGNQSAAGFSKGRPAIVTQQLIAALNDKKKGDSVTRIRKMVEGLIDHATGVEYITDAGEKLKRSVDMDAIKFIFDRIDGKIPEALELAASSDATVSQEEVLPSIHIHFGTPPKPAQDEAGTGR